MEDIKKKQYILCVRLTHKQLNTLRQQSIEHNLCVSEYIRYIIKIKETENESI
jgi:hypothetical protein